jgi:hypothetical protein
MAEPGGAASLLNRVRNILLHPTAEWDRIKGEQTSLQSLLVGYVLPLSALAALCGFIGLAFVGVSMGLGDPFRYPLQIALGSAIVSVVLALVIVWVMGLIINAIAPSFGAAQDQMQANKLAAYFPTAFWAASVFQIFPLISFLSIAGFYSFYLLYVGLPRLMNAPQDKSLGYFITMVVIGLIAVLVHFMATGAVQRMAAPSMIPNVPM